MNQRWVMRWSADPGLPLATGRFDATFFLVTACAVALVVGELAEAKGDDPIPMSPWNQAQPLALAACASAITAIDAMNVAFISFIL